MKKLFIIIITALQFISCSTKNSSDKVIKDYISHIYPNNKILNISIEFNDSLYSSVYRHPSFTDEQSRLYGNFIDLKKDIERYNNFKKLYNEDFINKELIKFNQNVIREGFRVSNDLKKNFKPKFIGYKLGVKVVYETDFNDSTAVFILEMNEAMDSIMHDIILPFELTDDKSVQSYRIYQGSDLEDLIDTTIFLKFN